MTRLLLAAAKPLFVAPLPLAVQTLLQHLTFCCCMLLAGPNHVSCWLAAACVVIVVVVPLEIAAEWLVS